MMKISARTYPYWEEFVNVLSHGIGFLLSVAALTLMVVFASLDGNAWHIVGVSIFGASLVVLYLASTLFHWSVRPKVRKYLNVFDHSAIYVLIAGTYTPFLLVTLNGPWGWSLFGVIWGLAIAGVVFKMFFTGKYDKLSLIIYVLMGWLILIAIVPLIQNLSTMGLIWLLIGGISYSIGAVFYLLNKMPFNHAIFHFWVLGGSICHFFAVFWYVIP
ncbi:MAG: hemolysin III family protein [Bacteroidales bacterium]|jgi:hemolysin III|nr:hemolysin III family protein [Bacteroidales bacterium]